MNARRIYTTINSNTGCGKTRLLNNQKTLWLLCYAVVLSFASIAQTSVPHLQTNGNKTQLIVNDKPFLILGGELGYSCASSRMFMQPVWSKLVAMHLNTVLLLDKQNRVDTFTFGSYIFKVSHDNTIGWNGHKMDSLWDATGAIIIQNAPDEFIVGGTGIIINFSCTDSTYNAGILAIENGTFDNGKWQPYLRLNSDEDHQGRHLRIPLNEWGIQRVQLYRYK